MSSWPPEFIADGKIVRLEMSRLEHANDLAEVVAKGQLHKLWYTIIPASASLQCRDTDRTLTDMIRVFELRLLGPLLHMAEPALSP